MTHTDVVKADAAGNLPLLLRQGWKQQHLGFDPVTDSKNFLKGVEKKKNRQYIHMTAFVIGFILTGASITFGNTGLEVRGVLGTVGFLIGLILIFIGGYLWLDNIDTMERWIQESSEFSRSLSSLCDWFGLPLLDLAGRNLEELQALAKRVLINQAKKVIDLEIANKDVPIEHWKGLKKRHIDMFECKWQELKEFGLGGGPYNQYYNQAKRELGVTK